MTKQLEWATITPSYNLDFERCRLLCRSMDAFLSGPWHHYIIVDPVDLPLFKPLSGPRRSVIDKREILPKGMHFIGKVPFMRLGRMWWSWKHGPVFGWQMQQVVKIAMASYVNQDAMAFWDSDVFFLRPFDVMQLSRGQKIRFAAEEVEELKSDPLVVNSAKVLRLTPSEVTAFSHGDSIVTWHRPTAVAMQMHLTKIHGRPWHEAIGSKLMFSEFAMYRMFVSSFQPHNQSLYLDNRSYCKSLWTRDQAARTDIASFCQELGPDQVAVCVQSALGIDIVLLEQQLDIAIATHANRSGVQPPA